MALLNNQKTETNLTPRQVLENKYKNSSHNILLVLIFSVINIFFLVSNSDTYFLFSAYIPYVLADIGMMLTGSYPEDYYAAMELTDMVFLGKGFLWTMLAIVAVILVLYLLSWVFVKKNRVGWMVFALVLFALDTAFMLWDVGITMDFVVDYVFHLWVIVSLSMGISAGSKLKKLPPEPEAPVVETAPAEEPQPEE